VIYDNIEKGMPVICYYLDGTGYESDSIGIGTEQETEQETTNEQESTITVDNSEITNDEQQTADTGIPVATDVTTDVPQLQ
jgi:hypothetical protein